MVLHDDLVGDWEVFTFPLLDKVGPVVVVAVVLILIVRLRCALWLLELAVQCGLRRSRLSGSLSKGESLGKPFGGRAAPTRRRLTSDRFVLAIRDASTLLFATLPNAIGRPFSSIFEGRS